MLKRINFLAPFLISVSVTTLAQHSVVRTEYGAPGDRLGTGVVNVGDWNNDNIADYAVAAYLFDLPVTNAGKVEVRSGADGLEDLVVTEIADDTTGTDTGRIVLFNYPAPKIMPPLPFTEGFDALAANTPGSGLTEISLPQGWTGRAFPQPDDIVQVRHWMVSSGAVSSVAGPGFDSTVPGDGTGNYIHMDDNGDDAELTVMTPVLDLTRAGHPVLTFWLHSHNRTASPLLSENTLVVDVFDIATSTYNLDFAGPYGHDATDDWARKEVDLSLFAGKKIRLRLRASNTNQGNATNTHNIAIDDLSVFDTDTHRRGQDARVGLAHFELGNSEAEYWTHLGMTGPFPSNVAQEETLRFSFDGQPNQGVMCFFGPENPSHTPYGDVGLLDCGAPDNNFDGLPELLFLVGDGISPSTFLDLAFYTGSAGLTFIDFPLPATLPPGELSTFQCLFGSPLGVRLSNAVTLTVD